MVPAAVTPYNNRRDIPELLVITSSAEINGSLFADAIVQMDCSVHVRTRTVRPSSSAMPTAAASIGSRMHWPNRAAESSLSPILPRPGAFAPRRRMPRSTFFMGCMLAPRAGLQSLTRNLSSTAQSSSPNGTLSPARTDGRAAVRLTSTPARTGSDFRWRRRPTFPDGSAF